MSPRADEVARRFWNEARLAEGYPRDIEYAVALVLPLAIVKLPSLTADEVRSWLSSNGIGVNLKPHVTALMGCLVARRGHGVVFVCGSDSTEEQRLTIAHETAHFLEDYLTPRTEVVRALGVEILPVLDGEREATPTERVSGVLSGVRLGAHVHVLARGEFEDGRVARAESLADDLGVELLAPRQAIDAFLASREGERLGPIDLQQALATRFGLPTYVFAAVVEDHYRRRPESFATSVLSAIREGM